MREKPSIAWKRPDENRKRVQSSNEIVEWKHQNHTVNRKWNNCKIDSEAMKMFGETEQNEHEFENRGIEWNDLIHTQHVRRNLIH